METPNHAAEIGKAWTYRQAEELLQKGFPALHFYVLNDSNLVLDVVRKLKK